jgi:hypothetical protein
MSDIIAFSSKYKLNTKTISDLILNIQNVSLFIISMSSFFACVNYNMHDMSYDDGTLLDKVVMPFDLLLPVVGLHATIDFFVTKSYDIKLHHIFVLGIIFYNYYNNVSVADRFLFLYPLLKTEISSFFYVLKYWLPKNSLISNINMLLFYGAFLKLRIYDYFYELINNQHPFHVLNTNYYQTNYYTYPILVVSCWGLYLLNVYWFLIMNKIVYKNIAKLITIDTDIMCHYVCSYIYWVNIPLAVSIYSSNPREKNIFDFIGVTTLSVSSFIYHFDIYNRLKTKEITEYLYPNNKNLVMFFNDSLFINLRAFLIVVTNYYNSPLFVPVMAISGLSHVISIYNLTLIIFDFCNNHEEAKDSFINIHNMNIAMPIALDVFLICANSPIEIAIPFLLVHITMGMLFVIEPFYKLTHVAFHILLVAENYYACSSSIRT